MGNIFITVGNGKFESLVREIDRLVGAGKIKDKVMIQLGHGKYKPKNCQWFTFESPLDRHYEKADIVISHGGPGCIFEILRMKKRLIGIPNRDRTDPMHQVEYLRAMAKETSGLIYCDKIDFLEDSINKAKKHKYGLYNPPRCIIAEVINGFITKKVK